MTRESESGVTDAHVEKARSIVKRNRLENTIHDRTELTQYILEAIGNFQ